MSRPQPAIASAAKWLVAAGCLGATISCGDPTSVETPLIRTAHASYDLDVSARGSLVGSVDYVFTNDTGMTVYIVNCQGRFDLLLERWIGGAWVTAWSPFNPQCLSAPIVIEPGTTFQDTVSIVSGCPALVYTPELDCSSPDGTYRILWVDALPSYQDHLPFGPQIPLPYRVSNSFELRRR